MDRRADSELKILEELRSQLQPGAKGRVRMVVDYPDADTRAAIDAVCQSCKEVAGHFNEEFRGIGIEIRDMYGRILLDIPAR